MRFDIATSLLSLFWIQGTFAGVPADEEYLLSEQINAQQEGPVIADDGSFDVIVQYKNKDGLDAVAGASKDGEITADFDSIGYAAITVKDVSALIELENNDDIGLVEMDGKVHTLVHERGPPIAADEYRRLQTQTESLPYGISYVRSLDVPGATTGFKPKVCVVDTGYDLDHVDLPTEGVEGFVPNEPAYAGQTFDVDGDNHGTHCAGTVGAIGGNGFGVTSNNPDPTAFTFFIGKGLTDTGSGTFSGVIAAMNACGNAGANIISMSLGANFDSSSMNAAAVSLYNQGILLVAAAGNGGPNAPFSYPASHPVVMSVASTTTSNSTSSFSQSNSQVEIAAPGSSVLSTIPDDQYAFFSGTSMATPHVAGVAARVWAHFPECTNYQIRTVLLRTARDFGSAGCDIQYGYGIVDAKAAFDLLTEYGCEGAGGDILPNPFSDEAPGGCAQVIPDLPADSPDPPTALPTPSPTDTPTPSPTGTPTKSPSDGSEDLILTAVLPNPNGNDRNFEYIIVENPSTSSTNINLDGGDEYQVCRVRGGNYVCKTLSGGVLGPGQSFVSCRNQLSYNRCDDTHGFGLRNRPAFDKVVLRKAETDIDETVYLDPLVGNTGRCWSRDPADSTSGFDYRDCPDMSISSTF